MEKIITIAGLRQSIIERKIIIYPTDTLYGLGCNALRDDLVLKIFKIKKRPLIKPLSVIAPSFFWIQENCHIGYIEKKAIEKYLPGPYTLIFKKKTKSFLSLATASKNNIGIRILNTDMQKIISKTNIPFITTSLNISGDRRILKHLNSLKNDIKKKIDYIVIGNSKNMSFTPSTIINLTRGNEIKIKRS